MLPLTPMEIEMMKALSSKTQLTQSEAMLLEEYKNRYNYSIRMGTPNVASQQQMMIQPIGFDNYGNPVYPNQNQMVNPNNVYYNQTAPMQSQVTQPTMSRYAHPTFNNGRVDAPTTQTTVNNSVLKYTQNEVADVYNQQNKPQPEIVTMQRHVEQAPAHIEKPVPPKPLVPNKGSELPWLTPKHFKLHKVVDNGTYDYEVINNTEEDIMDFAKHEAIYTDRVNSGEYVLNLADANKIIFGEGALVDSIDNAIDHALLAMPDDKPEFMVKPYMIATSFNVKKQSTDEVAYLFADIIAKSDSLQTLAYNLRRITNLNDQITYKAVQKLSEIITKNIMLGFKNVLINNWFIDSFIDDIDELYSEVINKITDASKKNKANNMLLNVFNKIKADNALIYDLVNTEETVNKIGQTYFLDKTTIVVINNEDIHYELVNTENDVLKSVNNDITPVVDDLLNKVRDKENAFVMYLIDYKTANVYRAMKSSINKMNTIERIR